ncbi:MAG: hypothetical protein LBQ55_04520, partial [Treponema sp.]|nr:hypothetical protein [Treponema sp.]
MKKSFLWRGIFFFLFCTTFGPAVSRGGFCGTADEVKGFNRTIFDYHFSRADRELSPEGWMAEARRGVGLALSAWEGIAAELYPDLLLMEEAENELRRWSEDELEARFTRWLFGRFFGEEAERAAESLSHTADLAHLRYTYHLDAEGGLLHDGKTGDPRIIRPGETDFHEDREFWKQAAEEGLLNEEARYGTALSASFPELLAYIAPERRDTFEEKLRAAGNTVRVSRRGEFEGLLAREERLFVARRTGDLYSLRRKSDDEAASMITSRLIDEAEAVCAGGIASLTARIEEAAAGTGDLALAGSEWLEEYREQFNRGLKAWEEAEERFFMRRIEWEQDAGARYAEGEESWIRAFERFEEERRRWELDVKALFESGERLFISASENLEKAIAGAREEFERDARLRAETGAAEAGAWVDMYLTAGSMVAEAGENIRYWLQFYGAYDAPGISDSRFEAWVEGELGKAKNSAGEYRAMLEEIKKWSQLYRTYTARAVEARDALAGEFGIVMGEGALTDILAEGAESSGFFLDEYQIELIRAKTLAAYWAKRLAIAEAVSAYAADLTAGRMTDTEGLEAWKESKRAYDEALGNYETALTGINQAGTDLAGAQAALNEAAAALRKADERLVELNREYSSMMTVYVSEQNDFILEEFNLKYRELLEEYKLLNRSGAGAAYFRYLQGSIALANAQRRELNGEKLKALILGFEGESSLAALREAAERARRFDGEEALPEAMGDYGLAEDNPYYELIESLLPEKALYHDLIVSLCEAAKSSLEAELELRLQGLGLFSAGSSAEWYRGTGLHTLGEEEIADLSPESLMLHLSERAEASYRVLLEARIDLETEALEAFLDGTGPSGRTGLLATLCLTDREGAESALALLKNMKDKIGEGGEITAAEEEWFASGGSFFMAAEGYLKDQLDDFRWKSGLLELYRGYGNSIDYVEREAWDRALRGLEDFFASYGIETEGALFPDTEAVKEAVLAKGGDPLIHTAEFIDGINRQFFLLPPWLAGALDEWESAFAAYMYALTEGTDEGGSEGYWRSYLGRYVRQDDAETAGIPAAAEWAEGKILDAKEYADRRLNRLRDGMALYTENTAGGDGTASLAQVYLDDPAAAWNEAILHPADPLLEEDNTTAEMEYRMRFFNEEMLRGEIVRIGKIYELSGKDSKAVGEAMALQLKKIADQKEAVESAKNGYTLAADRFYEKGAEYDSRYVLLKTAQDHLEGTRFEYEKQDAIRRWASTAYLGGNPDEEDLCRSSLERAETVLRALESLYDGAGERRPYADEEYAQRYREYEESAGRMASVIGAADLLGKAILEKEDANLRFYRAYTHSLSVMGGNIRYEDDYRSPENRGDWDIRDIIGVNEKGMLCFSFKGIDEESLKILTDYFEKNSADGEGLREFSRFDEALQALNKRMAGYLISGEKYEQWCLARDFLIKTLAAANGDISYLKKNYQSADVLKPGTPLGELKYYKDWFTDDEVWEADANAVNLVNAFQYLAYLNMGAAERADLEFFTILNLLGGGGGSGSSFAIASVMKEYGYVTETVKNKYEYFASKCDDWWEPAFLYRGHRDRAKMVYNRLWPSYYYYMFTYISGASKVFTALSELNKNNKNYLDSCAALAVLQGEKEQNAVEWDDIAISLKAAGVLDEGIIGDVKNCWNMMMDEGGCVFYSVSGAMAGLVEWSTGVRNDKRQALEEQWEKDELVRVRNLSVFRAAAGAFIAGKADLEELSGFMEEAFGDKAPSQKNHLENMERTLRNEMDGVSAEGTEGRKADAAMAKEYADLVAWSIYQRSRAELAAREEEWNLERGDINEKYLTWQNTAVQILEKGREDWENGAARIRNAFDRWIAQFNEEYKRVDEVWDAAFLAGLEDKRAWLDRAAEAAERASSGAMLALVGADAEAGARAMDTRAPAGMTLVSQAAEAEGLLEELLGASGIRNMADAFKGIGGIAETAGTLVRRGSSGPGLWNAGAAKIAAANVIRESNAELAARESKRLAIAARMTARDAIALLESGVDGENENFRKSMDEMLIIGGQWRKNGNDYIKDIVVHSTLFDPVITEQKEIAGYRNYRLQLPEFKTNLEEGFLEKLDAFAIQALVRNLYKEVEEIQKDIFGGTEERKEVKIYNEIRYLDPGKFGLHIGYAPVNNPSPDIGRGKDGVILHPGAGELGRIMSDYYYWSVVDSNGIAMSNMAAWDRPLWDSRGSWFEAPTIRSISDLTLQVVTGAAALVAAAASPFTGGISAAGAVGMIAAAAAMGTTVNMIDDAVFFALDTGFGYKRFDEAGFEFGKKALITASSSVIGAAFGGAGAFQGITGTLVGKTGGLAGQVMVKTAVTGAEAALNGIVSSALNGIQYSREGGWSYSSGTFTGGLAGMGANVLSSVTSTLTSGVLGAWNSGADNIKLKGFSSTNITNVGKLNSLLGGLAGQGAGYALNGDFTLNVFNLGFMSGDYLSTGLLELRLGRNGQGMNFGSGGVNASLGAVAGAVKGAAVWGVNSLITDYTKRKDIDLPVTLRAQYGFGDKTQKGQLFDFIFGKAELHVAGDESFDGKTENEDGKRIVYLSGYREDMSVAEQMGLAVVLGHEAYRDGIVTKN